MSMGSGEEESSQRLCGTKLPTTLLERNARAFKEGIKIGVF